MQSLNPDNRTTSKFEQGVGAVLCRDFYAAQIEEEAREGKSGFFTQEYVESVYEWVCPDLTQIKLLNDVSTDIGHSAEIIEARVYQCP